MGLEGVEERARGCSVEESREGREGSHRCSSISSQISQRTVAELCFQVSSIATLGKLDKWLTSIMFDALSATQEDSPQAANKSTGILKDTRNPRPDFSIIFPTADEIRRSLDGYSSGSAIHMKIQTAAQAAQVAYLKPLLRHWAGDGEQHSASASLQTSIREAGRRRAAPHIKTYIRFTDSSMSKIDWAMVTSANLSTQAWGSAPNASGEVRVSSYEIGVVVWPGLWDDGDERGEPATSAPDTAATIMVPVFKKDTPDKIDTQQYGQVRKVIGFRMPYDLPLVRYGPSDMPWCATSSYTEPDWMGRSYNV